MGPRNLSWFGSSMRRQPTNCGKFIRNLNPKLVPALTTAHQVDAEVRKVLDNKPWDNPCCNNDGKRLLAVECAARHLGSIHPDYSIMTMKTPDVRRTKQAGLAATQRPARRRRLPPAWRCRVVRALIGSATLPSVTVERHAESQRVANYYAQQTKQREENGSCRGASAAQRNGGAP